MAEALAAGYQKGHRGQRLVDFVESWIVPRNKQERKVLREACSDLESATISIGCPFCGEHITTHLMDEDKRKKFLEKHKASCGAMAIEE